MTMAGHNYDHGQGDVCKKCGQVHRAIGWAAKNYERFGMRGHNYDHGNSTICKKCGKIHRVKIHRKGGMKGHNWDHGNDTVCKKCGKIHRKFTIDAKRVELSKRMSQHNKGHHWNKGIKKSDAMKQRYTVSIKKFYNTREGRRIQSVRASQMRHVYESTIEKILQRKLDELKVIYQKHKSFSLANGHIHRVDLFIVPCICIEVDGDYYHHYPIGTDRDRLVNKELLQQGFIVLRFWEHDIHEHLDECIDKILSAIDTCHAV